MLRVSGATIEGPRPSDLFDVFRDDDGDLVVVLADVKGIAESSASFLGSMLRQIRVALQTHEPLHQVVGELEMQLAVCPGVEVGLVILRLSQRDGKVELLNAGMPPVANALPGGQLSFHRPLSSPVGRRIGEVHPYELVPLVWGSAWLAVSDGMTSGLQDDQSMRALCTELEFADEAMSLSAATSEALYDALQRVLPRARFLRDDATCVCVGAEVQAKGGRFQSGIEALTSARLDRHGGTE